VTIAAAHNDPEMSCSTADGPPFSISSAESRVARALPAQAAGSHASPDHAHMDEAEAVVRPPVVMDGGKIVAEGRRAN